MNQFNSVAVRKVGYNNFNMSHDRKFSCNMGELIPIFVKDVLPGDRFRCDSEVFLRFAPMLAPIMHRVNVYVHYFFVPNRLVWTQWEEFITGGRLGTSAPVHPYITYNDSPGVLDAFAKGNLPDYFGMPVLDPLTPVSNELRVSALGLRAYQLIYNEYFRDQNLQDDQMQYVGTGSGEVLGAAIDNTTRLRYRAWQKDPFTSALPWAQRGGAVELPFEATVTYKEEAIASYGGGSPAFGDLSAGVGGVIEDSLNNPVTIDNIDEISAGSITIVDLRRAARLQEWLEKNATGGARYVEQILVHFNVRSSDARLQRPEYLGGGKQAVAVSEIVSTFQAEDSTLPQGNMAGHGVSYGRSNTFRRRFEEHGHVIGIMSVIPESAYQQGVPRMFTKFDKLDYAWPEFANIGEQEVKVKELWYDQGDDTSVNEETFGYQARYYEDKYIPSTVHADFRDNLAFWHLGRIFSAKPELNNAFVTTDPATMNRIFAVEGEDDKLWCHVYNRCHAIRPLPYFGTPTL